MGGKKMTAEQFDNAFLMKSSGISNDDVGKILGCSGDQIKAIMQVAKAAQASDIETLIRLRNVRRNVVDWACEKFSVSLENPAEPPAQEPASDNTALAFGKLIESIECLTKAVQAIDHRLSAMQLTQQGFRADMQQSIAKAIEAIHVEGDILTKEHIQMIETLGAIKSNTKRGYSG
jgi:hypothetical protein